MRIVTGSTETGALAGRLKNSPARFRYFAQRVDHRENWQPVQPERLAEELLVSLVAPLRRSYMCRRFVEPVAEVRRPKGLLYKACKALISAFCPASLLSWADRATVLRSLNSGGHVR
jgi:hypothetical protein